MNHRSNVKTYHHISAENAGTKKEQDSRGGELQIVVSIIANFFVDMDPVGDV